MMTFGIERCCKSPEATVRQVRVLETKRIPDPAADVARLAAFHLDIAWMMRIASAVHVRHPHFASVLCMTIPADDVPQAHATVAGIDIRLIRGAVHLLLRVCASRQCRDGSKHCCALLAPV